MANKGKPFELTIAHKLGGSRVYSQHEDMYDIITDWVIAECKNRATMTYKELEGWLNKVRWEAERVSLAEGKNYLPLLITKRRGGKGKPTETIVMLRLEDFIEHFGRG